MLWVIQNNLYNERGYVRFIKALERLGVDHLIVKPVPFTNILLPADFDSMTQNVEDVEEPYIDDHQKVIVFGATSLNRVAKSKGWYPGTYLNDNFNFGVWRDGFGEYNVLNGDAEIGTVIDIKVPNHDWLFVRPVHDNKAFNGMMLSKYDLDDWMKSISIIDETDEFLLLHKNTEIMISSAKKIFSEYRLFVVNGEIVTGSMYKQGSQVIEDENVPDEVLNFAYDMIGNWQAKVDMRLIPNVRVPTKAFAIDIANVPSGLKVIEINNINSAGFYAADVQKIIMAIEDMEA